MHAKVAQLNVRISEEVYADLRTTSRLRGLSVSSLVHMLVVKAIRDEKAIAPEEFAKPQESHADKNGDTQKRGDWRESAKELQKFWKDRDDLPDIDELRRSWDRNVWNEDARKETVN